MSREARRTTPLDAAFAPPTAVRPTRHLLTLTNDRGEAILLNTARTRPLLVRRGIDAVRRFLAAAEETREIASLAERFPEERDLLRFLLAHHILVGEADAEDAASDTSVATTDRGPADTPGSEPETPTRAAMSLYLLLSQGCNLACIYCLNGQKTYRKRQRPKMPAEIAFRAIRKCLQSITPGGHLEIVFFGGEPLLNWPLAKECIRRCESHYKREFPEVEIRYHLTTNLSFMPRDLLAWAGEHRISFLVDVDGPPELHDRLRPLRGGRPSHSLISDNIRTLAERGFEVALRATITRHNVEAMPEVVEHHRRLGGKSSALVPVNPVDSDEFVIPTSWLPDPERFARGLRRVFRARHFPAERLFPFSEFAHKLELQSPHSIACGAPWGNTPTVTVEGDVYPCIYWVGIPRLKMGSVLEPGPFRDSRVCARLRHELHVDNIERCRRCDWRYLCGGGCPVHRVLIEGRTEEERAAVSYAEEITCSTAKEALSLLLWERAAGRVGGADPGERRPAGREPARRRPRESQVC